MSDKLQKKERNSSIELLRLLAGFAVIVLHYNFYPLGGGAVEVVEHSYVNYYFLITMEIICVPAVNIFLIITGYFNCNKTYVKLNKTLKLIVQVIVFNMLTYLIFIVGGGTKELTLRGIVGSMIPVNYYTILYVVLYMISPYINLLLAKLEIEQFKNMVILLFLIFSVYATGVDIIEELLGKELSGLSSISIEGSQRGYSIVNFMLCYIIGAYIKKGKIEKKLSNNKLIGMWFLSVIILELWRLVLPDTAWEYCNPVLLIEGICIFILFSKMKINSKIVNILASATFTCFLLNGSLLGKIDFSILEEKAILFLISHMIIVIVVIYFISYIVDNIWKRIIEPVFLKLDRYIGCISCFKSNSK